MQSNLTHCVSSHLVCCVQALTFSSFRLPTPTGTRLSVPSWGQSKYSSLLFVPLQGFLIKVRCTRKRRKVSTGQGQRGQGVRKKPRLETQTLILGIKWIIPLSRAQRMLGRLRPESRNEIRSRKQKKNKRVTSGLFFPGDFKKLQYSLKERGQKVAQGCPTWVLEKGGHVSDLSYCPK